MPKQLPLFDFEKHFTEVWDLSRPSTEDAAAIVIELLRAGRDTVTFSDIVTHKMGLEGDQVPQTRALVFGDQLRAVIDSRHRIRALVEDGGFLVTIIDRQGRPSERGGSPEGFALYATMAGASSTHAQLQMTFAKIKRQALRIQGAGHLSDADYALALSAVDVLETKLIPADPAAADLFSEAEVRGGGDPV